MLLKVTTIWVSDGDRSDVECGLQLSAALCHFCHWTPKLHKALQGVSCYELLFAGLKHSLRAGQDTHTISSSQDTEFLMWQTRSVILESRGVLQRGGHRAETW